MLDGWFDYSWQGLGLMVGVLLTSERGCDVAQMIWPSEHGCDGWPGDSSESRAWCVRRAPMLPQPGPSLKRALTLRCIHAHIGDVGTNSRWHVACGRQCAWLFGCVRPELVLRDHYMAMDAVSDV